MTQASAVVGIEASRGKSPFQGNARTRRTRFTARTRIDRAHPLDWWTLRRARLRGKDATHLARARCSHERMTYHGRRRHRGTYAATARQNRLAWEP
jgi:hypothetical protein